MTIPAAGHPLCEAHHQLSGFFDRCTCAILRQAEALGLEKAAKIVDEWPYGVVDHLAEDIRSQAAKLVARN